jgi:hypothetical protein
MKENPLLTRQAEFPKGRPLLGEAKDVPFDGRQRRFGQNHFIACDRLELMHANALRLSRPLVGRLERQHPPSVAAAFRQPAFERVENPGAHRGACFTWRRDDLHDEARRLAVPLRLRQHDGKRTAILAQQPESRFQACHGLAADIDVFDLSRSDFQRAVVLGQKPREIERLVAVLVPDTDEIVRNAALTE